MNGKSAVSKTDERETDDAPELTETMLDRMMDQGDWRIGTRSVNPEEGKQAFRKAMKVGRPPGSGAKISTTVRFDADILQAFRATGKGWQTRMNDALKEWLRTHNPS